MQKFSELFCSGKTPTKKEALEYASSLLDEMSSAHKRIVRVTNIDSMVTLFFSASLMVFGFGILWAMLASEIQSYHAGWQVSAQLSFLASLFFAKYVGAIRRAALWEGNCVHEVRQNFALIKLMGGLEE